MCSSACPAAGLAPQLCSVPGCRWQGDGWHTSPAVLPAAWYSSGLAKAASARKTTSLPLSALDLGRQQFFPALGAVDIAKPQLDREATAFVVEQQQRMMTGGLEVPVVGALLLRGLDRNRGAVHVQHHPPWRIDGFRLRDQLPVDPRQPGEVYLLRQHFRLERLQA